MVAGRAPDFLLANQASLGEKLSVTSSAAKCRSRVLHRLFELLLASSAVVAKLCFKSWARGHWRARVIFLGALSPASIVSLTECPPPAGDCLGLGVKTLCTSVPALLPKFPCMLLNSLVSGASLGSANEFKDLFAISKHSTRSSSTFLQLVHRRTSAFAPRHFPSTSRI